MGDQGMISHKAIGELKQIVGLMWITALRSGQINTLVQSEALHGCQTLLQALPTFVRNTCFTAVSALSVTHVLVKIARRWSC